MVLQPLAIIVLLVAAAQLIDGTRWLVLLPPVAVLLVFWAGQAIHAYRRAIELGAAPGGELQAAVFLGCAVAVLTVFWLVGGRHGSPSSTLEAYVIAWMNGRSVVAAQLYVVPPTQEQLEATWSAQSAYLADRVTELEDQYGPASGLDPSVPSDSLRFAEPVVTGPATATVEVDIVRSEQVQTMVFGLIPTASQQTVVVETAGTIRLALIEEAVPTWVPLGGLHESAWRIATVTLGAPD